MSTRRVEAPIRCSGGLGVVRYVDRAEDWPWSSLGSGAAGLERAPQIDSERFERGPGWTDVVNSPQTEAEADALAVSIRRNRPYGADDWVCAAAEGLGLTSSIRERTTAKTRRREFEVDPRTPKLHRSIRMASFPSLLSMNRENRCL